MFKCRPYPWQVWKKLTKHRQKLTTLLHFFSSSSTGRGGIWRRNTSQDSSYIEQRARALARERGNTVVNEHSLPSVCLLNMLHCVVWWVFFSLTFQGMLSGRLSYDSSVVNCNGNLWLNFSNDLNDDLGTLDVVFCRMICLTKICDSATNLKSSSQVSKKTKLRER